MDVFRARENQRLTITSEDIRNVLRERGNPNPPRVFLDTRGLLQYYINAYLKGDYSHDLIRNNALNLLFTDPLLGVQLLDPWMLQRYLYNNPIARQMFNIQDPDRLPITVKIGITPHTHNLSRENVQGIIAFFYAVDIHHPLTLYGTTVEETGLFQDDPIPLNGFTVKIGDELHVFKTPDFIQGALTGALWTDSSAEARIIITNLTQYVNGIPHSLTF